MKDVRWGEAGMNQQDILPSGRVLMFALPPMSFMFNSAPLQEVYQGNALFSFLQGAVSENRKETDSTPHAQILESALAYSVSLTSVLRLWHQVDIPYRSCLLVESNFRKIPLKTKLLLGKYRIC